MSYLRYLCLFGHMGVQRILRSVVCCFVFLRLVYTILLVSVDRSFLIAPSVYLLCSVL